MSASGGGEESSSDAGKNTAYIAGGIGIGVFGCIIGPLLFLLLLAGTIVMCALGWIFWPIVLLCEIGILPCDADSGGGGGVDTDQIVAAFNSDGKAALKEGAVPDEYLSDIEDAGAECSQIGAIVIVSQIQAESQFNPKLVGLDGKEGISQLPPDKFKEFGEDDDDNDKTSALDASDSIMAQGRYMCSLAKEIDTLIANNEVKGNSLDMTLAAYTAGLDAVKAAKGVPDTDKAQSYVVSVRSSFALYTDSVDLGEDDEEYPSLSPRPTPSTT
ncbi:MULTISPECIES: transglycosylase SLT domain-containing protein [unclassified Streptomyces]|uniref:transglycosylase SLT domain-containing protein n=1 Tax=unclassified Streptomyces TaxID=2593676 RepID=UPI0036574ADF